MATEVAILKLVEALAAARPFKLDAVERLTGVALPKVDAESNAHFAVHRCPPQTGKAFVTCELRLPLSPRPPRDGLVILTVPPSPCVTPADVARVYGDRFELEVPTPRQPPEAPLYRVYRQPWGRLSFGFARQGSECLTTVVLDVTQPPPPPE
jgi:hypothetical protein